MLAQAPPEPGGKVIDLMEALKKSLAQRSGAATDASEAAPKASKRDTSPTRKSAQRKSAQRKTPAKKAASKTRASKAKSKAPSTRTRPKTQRTRQKKSA